MSYHLNQIVAHRGYQDNYPENSLLGVYAAMALGARWVEVDLQCKDDGTVLLYHDDTMERISGIDQSIHQLTAKNYSTYFNAEPQRLGQQYQKNPINRLKQLLAFMRAYPDVSFFLEKKEESIYRYGVNGCIDCLLSELEGIPANAIFLSFSHEAVFAAKQKGFSNTALVTREWHTRNEQLRETRADYLFVNHERIPEQLPIKALTPVVAYEVANISLAHQLIDQGCFAVETFCFETLLSGVSRAFDTKLVG